MFNRAEVYSCAGRSDAGDGVEAASGERGVIFVVDDSERVRLSVCRMIAFHGFVGRSVDPDGFEAALAVEVPDVIVLDLQMPGHDTPGIVRMLRTRFATRPVPTILYSGIDKLQLQTIAAQCGATTFASKGDGPTGLLAALDIALARTRSGEVPIVSRE